MAKIQSVHGKTKNVQYTTYLSWHVDKTFEVDVEEIDHRRYVTKIWCKSCRKHSDKIRLDTRLRGNAKAECASFAEGSTNVVKSAVSRHLESLVRLTTLIANALLNWYA